MRTLRSETIFSNFWQDNFLSGIFGHVEKRINKKDKVNFKIYNVTTWLTKNCNTHIVQYLKE